MIGRATSVVLQGLQPQLAEIEVLKKRGIPGFYFLSVSGHKAIALRQKLSAASQLGGWHLPSVKWLINCYPQLPELNWSYLELPILVAVLRAQGLLPPPITGEVWAGELGLDGQVRLDSAAALRIVWAAQQLGRQRLHLPTTSLLATHPWLGSLPQLPTLYNCSTLERVSQPGAPEQITPSQTVSISFDPAAWKTTKLAWLAIEGQWPAKRALVIATLGRHHTLLVGPPGVGKTHLSQSLAGWLPNLSPAQHLTVAVITASYHAHLPDSLHRPPVRQPHHTLSPSGLLGGGQPTKPGELTLAHHGFLLLDELAEFPPATLEALRQPLENRQVELHKNHSRSVWPANTTIIATTNPCQCGYWQHPHRGCHCNLTTRQRYWDKLSGPVRDRFELVVRMEPTAELASQPPPEIARQPSTQKLDHWHRAVQLLALLKNNPDHYLKIQPTAAAQQRWQKALLRLGLSHRSHHQSWRVAETIAQFEWALDITKTWPLAGLKALKAKHLKRGSILISLEANHVVEALEYRASWGSEEL